MGEYHRINTVLANFFTQDILFERSAKGVELRSDIKYSQYKKISIKGMEFLMEKM